MYELKNTKKKHKNLKTGKLLYYFFAFPPTGWSNKRSLCLFNIPHFCFLALMNDNKITTSVILYHSFKRKLESMIYPKYIKSEVNNIIVNGAYS